MKKSLKILVSLLTLAALSFGFVACSNSADSNDNLNINSSYNESPKKQRAAYFRGKNENDIGQGGDYYAYIFEFYKDNTCYCYRFPCTDYKRAGADEDYLKATYSFHEGNFTDGNLILDDLYALGVEGLIKVPGKWQIIINNEKFNYNGIIFNP